MENGGEENLSLIEVREEHRLIYGPNLNPEKYEGELGTWLVFICIIGFSLIPIEIFIKDLLDSSIENPIIIKLQRASLNNNTR